MDLPGPLSGEGDAVMEQVSIRRVAAWTVGRYEGPDLPVTGVVIDSRAVQPGHLFVALKGARDDGHRFLGEAFASGAAAALVDAPEVAAAHRAMGRSVILVEDARRALGLLAAGYRRSLDLKVIGVTGSNGKTTTKEMLRLLLGARAVVSPASFNNDLGVPLTLLRANRTHKFVVCEIGSSAPGEIAALAAIARPDVGIVLNVGESHLKGLGDLDGVAREKEALIAALPADGCAILNFDDPVTREMMERAPCLALSFGTWPDADVSANDVRASGYSLGFKLFGRRRVTLDAIGVHNVHNALAAIAAALWLGEHACAVADRIEAFSPAPMRMSVERVGAVRLVNDAYNANPRSVAAALSEMSCRDAGRRIAVLGDMRELGPRSMELHETVGRRAGRAGIDVVWAIGQSGKHIAAAARRAGVRHVHWTASVDDAVANPPIEPTDGDVFLFKASRSMRLERVAAAVRSRIEAGAPSGPDRNRRLPPKTSPSVPAVRDSLPQSMTRRKTELPSPQVEDRGPTRRSKR